MTLSSQLSIFDIQILLNPLTPTKTFTVQYALYVILIHKGTYASSFEA